MSYINFYRGLKAKYDATTYANGIYFATDAKEIIVNGISYIGSLADLGDEKLIKAVSTNDDDSKLIITYVDDSTKEITLSTASGEYDSAIDDPDLAMPNAVGGIAKGTKLSQLEGRTYDSILDDLLFPTVNPTFSAPTASISLKSGYAATQEIGSAAPTADNFTTGYNAGQITLNGVKQDNRGGSQDTANSFIYYGNSADNKTLPTTVAEGSVSYKYRAAFNEGPQPKDNKGNDYSSPLAASHVDSSAVTVYGVYPYFANTSNESFSKLSLTTGTTLSAIKLAAEGPNKHAFKLPAKYTLTKTELLNTLSGKYENFATSNWTATDETISVQGTDVAYKVYTRNDDGFNGESTFNITFSK